jgi:hypothetical protein
MSPCLSDRATACPGQRGFAASVIVLALVGVLAALVMANGRVLHSLQRELRQVEQRQLRAAGALVVTNLPRPRADLPGPPR